MNKWAVLVLSIAYCLAQDCQLLIPPNPLTAAGLATPYEVTGCLQSDPGQASFVQGAIVDLQTGKISIYNPLVVTAGTKPAVNPTVPTLPANGFVIGLWFGTNGASLTLTGNLGSGNCVNGGKDGSIFGQFAYCNAAQFYAAANLAIGSGQLVVPPLGTANDGKPCPTVRDFFVVDMDQSDNVDTEYLVVGNQTAQNTATNRRNLRNNQVLLNGSDNRLLAVIMDTAMGCTPFTAPDLADNGNPVTALPLNELHAAAHQQAPIALVALNHAMTRVNGQPSMDKVNAYRSGVNMAAAATTADADSLQYCYNMYHVQPQRLLANEQNFLNFGSPDAGMANSLFAFLAARFNSSFGVNGLNCQVLLNVPPPVILTMNMDGVVVGAVINPPPPLGTATKKKNTALIIGLCVGGGGALILLIAGVVGYRYYKQRNGGYL